MYVGKSVMYIHVGVRSLKPWYHWFYSHLLNYCIVVDSFFFLTKRHNFSVCKETKTVHLLPPEYHRVQIYFEHLDRKIPNNLVTFSCLNCLTNNECQLKFQDFYL